MYIENLIGEHTSHIDESNWHYLMIGAAEFYEELEKIFCHTSIDDYSINMECVSSTDEGQLYAVSIAWYFEAELNHIMEFVVI